MWGAFMQPNFLLSDWNSPAVGDTRMDCGREKYADRFGLGHTLSLARIACGRLRFSSIVRVYTD